MLRCDIFYSNKHRDTSNPNIRFSNSSPPLKSSLPFRNGYRNVFRSIQSETLAQRFPITFGSSRADQCFSNQLSSKYIWWIIENVSSEFICGCNEREYWILDEEVQLLSNNESRTFIANPAQVLYFPLVITVLWKMLLLQPVS